jgi:hypothetical protein
MREWKGDVSNRNFLKNCSRKLRHFTQLTCCDNVEESSRYAPTMPRISIIPTQTIFPPCVRTPRKGPIPKDRNYYMSMFALCIIIEIEYLIVEAWPCHDQGTGWRDRGTHRDARMVHGKRKEEKSTYLDLANQRLCPN